MKFDLKKSFTKAGEAIKEAADNVKDNAQAFAGKVKEENQKVLYKKYDPVFREAYESPDFGLPNVIVIVDDASYKDINKLDGAIGWKQNDNDVEVFYLYDEFMNDCGLQFIPVASCDTAYYVDPHDRTHFIKLDSFFARMQQSMLAELSNIASCLGARRYSVELINVSEKKSSFAKALGGQVSLFGPKGGAGTASSISQETGKRAKSLAAAEFESSREPVMPELSWFKHDENIAQLIKTVYEERCPAKMYNIELSGSEYSGMSQTAAKNIQAALLRNKIKLGADIRSKAMEMNSHIMNFHLEF